MIDPNTQTAPPLPLADLHLPTEPGFFPLAYGWWLVIFLGLLACGFIGNFLYQKIKHRRAKQAAIRALKKCQSVAEINTLLKRAALSYFPRQAIAPLTGSDWLRFLDDKLEQKQQGFVNLQEEWIKACYSDNRHLDKVSANDTLNSARALALIWLKKALPAKKAITKNHEEPRHV